jgi:DNA-binding CsgD family transcriptional regulator
VSAEPLVSAAGVAEAMTRAPAAVLLVDTEGLVYAANDAAAQLVDLREASDVVGTDVFRFTPEALARHRLHDVADGTVEAALARVEVTTASDRHRTLTAWWRRLETDEGVRALVVLTPLELTPTAAPSMPAAGWLALLTTDHEWQVVDLSSDMQRLLHREDLTGHGLLGLIHPLDVNDCLTALAMLTDSTQSVTATARIHGRDGWQQMHIIFARLCAHQPPRLVCVFARDVAPTAPSQHLDELLQQRETGQLLAHLGRALERAATAHDLSAQEAEIIARSVRGAGPRRIAEEMYLAEGTVRNLLSGLYRKFDVHTQLELVSAILHAN